MDEGHCRLPTDELVPLAEKLLEVPVELVRTALDLELAEGIVIADSVGKTRCVFWLSCIGRSVASPHADGRVMVTRSRARARRSSCACPAMPRNDRSARTANQHR
jgi:hypothetical protein